MTRLNTAAKILRDLGNEGDAAAAYLLMLDETKSEAERIEITRKVHTQKAEQYRGYKGESAARRAEIYQAIADALDNLPSEPMKTTIVTKPEEVSELRGALDFEAHEAADWFGFANYAEKDKNNPELAKKLRAFGRAIMDRRDVYLSKSLEVEIAGLWK